MVPTGLPDEPKAFDRPAWKGRSDAQGRFVADSSKSWLEGVALWPSSESIVAYHSGSTVTEVKIGPRSKISPANPLRVVLRRAVAKGLPLAVLDPNGTPIAGAKILTRSFGTLFSSTPVEFCRPPFRYDGNGRTGQPRGVFAGRMRPMSRSRRKSSVLRR